MRRKRFFHAGRYARSAGRRNGAKKSPPGAGPAGEMGEMGEVGAVDGR